MSARRAWSAEQPTIESQLDYIQGMGFNTVWISPVVENTEGGYHGYYGKDLRSAYLHCHPPGLALLNRPSQS